MSMSIKRCPRESCGRPFQVNQFNFTFDAQLPQDHMTCPHCGVPISTDGSAVHVTHPLSQEEEARYWNQLDRPEGNR